MKIGLSAGRILSACVIALSGNAPARAANLEGAWADNAEVCSKIFAKENNRISFTRNSDLYGSGMIIEPNALRGKTATCRIKTRKTDGPIVNLLTECSTDVAVSTVQFTFRIDAVDKLTRLYPGIPELTTTYVRCLSPMGTP